MYVLCQVNLKLVNMSWEDLSHVHTHVQLRERDLEGVVSVYGVL